MLLHVSPGHTQYIFHTSMARYSLFVLKVSLNTNQPTNQPTYDEFSNFNVCLARAMRNADWHD